MINLTVENIDAFVEAIREKVDAATNSTDIGDNTSELNIYVDKSKIKWGRSQINIVLRSNRRKQVYSVYMLESERNGESILPILVVNNSSIKHNIMYMNSADDSLDKSLEYIVQMIIKGFERLHRYSSNYHRHDRRNHNNYHKTESVESEKCCENCDKEKCECENKE